MIKVLIADDYAIVRKGLKELIQEQADMKVVGEANNGLEALNMARENEWDVLVLDISMPLCSGLEVLQAVHLIKSQLPILMLSFYSEEQCGIQALKAGAAGYLNKGSALNQLIDAIRKVSVGGKYISPALAEHMIFGLDDEFSQTPHKRLSEREYEVMRRLAISKPVDTIARELVLSPQTVSTYRIRILQKLGLKKQL